MTFVMKMIAHLRLNAGTAFAAVLSAGPEGTDFRVHHPRKSAEVSRFASSVRFPLSPKP